MEIKSIEYKNVYGFLSAKLQFKKGENFLVGINGCGKTTILNLVNWVLTPCFPELCTLSHDLISITVILDSVEFCVKSEIRDQKHVLSVTSKDKGKIFKPIVTNLAVDPSVN